MGESTSAAAQTAYHEFVALGVADQSNALRMLCHEHHRAGLSVADMVSLLSMFPLGDLMDIPSADEAAGLFAAVDHRESPDCECPACLVAAEELGVVDVQVSADAEAEFTPTAVRLVIDGVGLSRLELLAALYDLSILTPDELAELAPAEVRQTVTDALLFHGQRTLHHTAERLASDGPRTVWDAAHWELCERLAEVAFGMPQRRYEYLMSWLPPFEAWRFFLAEHGTVPAEARRPVSPAPAGGRRVGDAAIADEVQPAQETGVA